MQEVDASDSLMQSGWLAMREAALRGEEIREGGQMYYMICIIDVYFLSIGKYYLISNYHFEFKVFSSKDSSGSSSTVETVTVTSSESLRTALRRCGGTKESGPESVIRCYDRVCRNSRRIGISIGIGILGIWVSGVSGEQGYPY